MIGVSEAQGLIRQHAQPLEPELIPLTAALGLVLAEDVVSDLAMPPYDKALMDGYAVRSADLASGRAVLRVVDEITAGRTPRVPVGNGEAARIMTGAPLPEGADAVIMVEHSRLVEGDRVELTDAPRPGLNILAQGREMQPGETVLKTGAVLRPQEWRSTTTAAIATRRLRRWTRRPTRSRRR